MSEPTKAARRAADKIHRSKEEHTDRSLAMIIDRETGLPELVAALRTCRDACERAGMMGAVAHANIALRKAGEL